MQAAGRSLRVAPAERLSLSALPFSAASMRRVRVSRRVVFCRAEIGSVRSVTTPVNGKTPEADGATASSNGQLARGDWGSKVEEDWAPNERFAEIANLEEEYRRYEQYRQSGTAPRDKWITPLLDWRSVTEAVDPDQERTEDSLQDEALTNKESTITAMRFAAQLFFIPLATGFLVSRLLAAPILEFTLHRNPEAFAMSEHQVHEGSEKVHVEETRIKMDMALGRVDIMDDAELKRHLREFAHEVQEEEREQNEKNLVTLVSDTVSWIVLFAILGRRTIGREALFSTLSRLFEGLSDIAKAVGIILIADTIVGYHSEEGWTGLIELVAGHYGYEPAETPVIVFVAVIPIAIDTWFKYWIFKGLNKISPSAVVTIKAIDRH